MKKVYFAFLSCLITSYGIAQNTEFLKRVENKYIVSTIKKDSTGKEKIEGRDNVRSKGVVEKLLFGNTNGIVEFYVCPSFEGAYGFRTVRDSSDTFLLEIKRIANWKEAAEEAEKKYPTVGIPLTLISSLPQNIVNLTTDHNNAMWPLQEEERLKLYKVKSSSIPISNRLAEKLYAKFVSFIDDFKAKELEPNLLMGDGETTVFRCIVDQEIWTLSIPFKTEEKARELSDLCKQIVEDAEAGRFDESKYIGRLEDYGQEDCN